MLPSFLGETSNKNSTIKREILRLCITHNNYSIADFSRYSIADFSRALGISVPTITKLISELIDDNFIQDEGKVGTSGGRRPSVFGLNPEAGYFVGVDIARHHFHVAISNFKGDIINFIQDIEFVLEANELSFRTICRMVKDVPHGQGRGHEERHTLDQGARPGSQPLRPREPREGLQPELLRKRRHPPEEHLREGVQASGEHRERLQGHGLRRIHEPRQRGRPQHDLHQPQLGPRHGHNHRRKALLRQIRLFRRDRPLPRPQQRHNLPLRQGGLPSSAGIPPRCSPPTRRTATSSSTRYSRRWRRATCSQSTA